MKDDDEQIKQVIALQRQIEENKKEVSRILGGIMKGNKLVTRGARIVVEGELWEVTRWPYGGLAKENFGAWCLKNRGKVFQAL